MFKIAISLTFKDINKSWHILLTLSWNLKPLFTKSNGEKYHTFDSLVLLTSIPSEMSVLSYYSIYNIQTFIQKNMYLTYPDTNLSLKIYYSSSYFYPY